MAERRFRRTQQKGARTALGLPRDLQLRQEKASSNLRRRGWELRAGLALPGGVVYRSTKEARLKEVELAFYVDQSSYELLHAVKFAPAKELPRAKSDYHPHRSYGGGSGERTCWMTLQEAGVVQHWRRAGAAKGFGQPWVDVVRGGGGGGGTAHLWRSRRRR